MNGVMMPGVSAGSNHVGASVTWMAQVAWPCAARAGAGRPETSRPARPAATSGTARRDRSNGIDEDLLTVWAAGHFRMRVAFGSESARDYRRIAGRVNPSAAVGAAA